MPISVWLLPDPPAYDEMSTKVSTIAAEHSLPPFAPHITLLGDAGESADAAVAKLQRLRASGVVPIRFTEVTAGRFPQGGEHAGEVPWFQSAVAVVEETPELLRIKRLTEGVFVGASALPQQEDESSPIMWAPPLNKPHMSLAYGNDPVLCDALQIPGPFCCDAVAVVDCSPATAEGSCSWKVLARVSLDYDLVGTPRVSMSD